MVHWLVPVSGHLDRLALCSFLLLSLFLLSHLWLTLWHLGVTPLKSLRGKSGTSIITCGRSITVEPEVLSSLACDMLCDEVFKLPWDSTTFDLGGTDKKIKSRCPALSQIAHGKQLRLWDARFGSLLFPSSACLSVSS